jgi:two-component system CheB/CheR fusion protein
MKKNWTRSADAAELRRQAEMRMEADKSREAPAHPTQDNQRLHHQLQVHQIELEMQNEELHRSRAEVEAGLERYTDLYDFAPVGYLTLDRDGTIRQANLTVADLLGAERARLMGMRLGLLVAEADRAAFNAFIERVFAGQAKEICEVTLIRGGDRPWHVRIEGVAANSGHECRVVVVDITNYKQIAEALLFLVHCGTPAMGEDFFRSLARYLAESLDMDFVRIDQLESQGLSARSVAMYFDGKFPDDVAYTLKDTPCGEVVGKRICCFPTGVRQLFPRDVVLQEMLAESYVGTTLWSSKGCPIGLIVVIGRQALANPQLAESILQLMAVRAAGELERRQAEEALRAAKTAAEATAQVKDEFLAKLSQELRAPLAPVVAAVGILERDGRLPADVREDLAMIGRNMTVETRLIDDLLDATRITHGKVHLDRSPVHLSSVLSQAAEICGGELAAKGLRLTLDLPERPCTVMGDAGRLQQVFWNLIKNAIKFTPAGGNIAVRTLVVADKGADGSTDEAVVVEIRDTGMGIEPGLLLRLFDPFEQGCQEIHRQYGGLGLGLTICKSLVEAHGGSITAASEGKDKGATFTVRLALAAAPERANGGGAGDCQQGLGGPCDVHGLPEAGGESG